MRVVALIVVSSIIVGTAVPGIAATAIRVTDISVKDFATKEQVAVAATGAITYTVATLQNPLRLEVRIHSASLDRVPEIPGGNVVKAVRAAARAGNVDVTILLRRQVPYDATYALGRHVLVLAFAKTAQASPEPQRFTLNFRNADIVDVFRTLSDLANVNIVVGSDVQGRISIRMVDVTFEEALQLVLEANRLGALRVGRSIVIMPLERLPAPSAVGKIYRLQHARATEVATMINTLQQQAVVARGGQAAGPRGAAVADPDTNSIFVVAPLEDHAIIEQFIASVDLPVPLKMVKLHYLDAKPAADLLRDLMAKEGPLVIREDIRANVLVFSGPEQLIRRAEALLAGLDTALPQVMIEARVVELNKGASQELGLTSLVVVQPPGTVIPPAGTILFEIATQTLEAFLRRLQALISEDKGRILAAPRIATLDGQPAVIRVGSTISVPVVGPQGTVGVQEINAGITLSITPRVNTDGMITTRLNPEVRSISSITPQGFIITERSAETQLTIRDGMSILIGGLLTDEEIETMTRIPILSEIPILGEFFKFRQTRRRESEIIIIITPRILTRQAPAP